MKAALPHVRHVQMNAQAVRNIVTENPAWNSAKNYAGHVQMPAANAQTNAIHKLCSSVPMPAAGVQKNVKSTTMSIVRNAQKNAVSVKQNAQRWQRNFSRTGCRLLKPVACLIFCFIIYNCCGVMLR